MTAPQITPQELAALQAFAMAHGRRWKHELTTTYWYNARVWRDRDGDVTYGTVLHGLRNRLGPEWLNTFRLPRPAL